MSSKNSLRRLFKNAFTRPAERFSRKRHLKQLRTEQLETRTLLTTFTVNTNADSGTGSLRQAIIDANGAAGADEIVFDASTNGSEFDLTSGQFEITASLTITGNGSNQTIIDAQQLSRIFNFQSGDFTLNSMTLKNGKTTGSGNSGGAIASSSSGVLTIQNSTLSNNSTAGIEGNGGAVYSNSGAVTISQSTLSGNQARGPNSDGGGLCFNDSVVTIVNSTITGNSAARSGGGLGMLANGTDKKLTIHNSIIAGNNATSSPDFTAPTSPTANLEVRSSLIGRSDGTSLTASSVPDTNGNLIGGTTDRTNINPLLAPLANNGGPTLTHALLINSPAFNRGSNARAVDVTQVGSPALTTDQRGTGFARNKFGIVDMGAMESAVLDSPDGTTGADALMLTYSSTSTSGNVVVIVSSNGGPVVNLGTFPMNSPLTINGLGGTDSVRVVGTRFPDRIAVNRSASLVVNGASLILTSIENRTLACGAGDDLYKFNADTALGLFTLDEFGGGTDTIDLAPTRIVGISLNLGNAATQIVHPTNLSLILGSATTFENAIGGDAADTLTGNSLNNTLIGGHGNDTLNGGGGSDALWGGWHNDTYVFGTAFSPEADVVNDSGPEIDTLSFSGLTTPVVLNLGSAAIQNVHTNRTLKLNSTATFENAVGGTAADTLNGNGLNNSLIGGAGNDKLTGGAGSDILSGGLNDDIYVFGTAAAAEADLVNEFANQGTDTLSFAGLTTSVLLNLGSSTVQNVHTNRTLKLSSAATFENAISGAADDTLIGNALNNRLTGGNGNNILVGLSGSDILVAGSGRDILIGGLGLDTLNGGAGDDILIAGRTTSDSSAANLNTLRTQWFSASSYAARVAALRAGVGSPVVSLKAKTNVLNDAIGGDSLTGTTGTDWYFRALDDVITDLVAGERIDVL